MIQTATNNGLHDFVADRVLPRYAKKGIRAADLGTGPGGMALRLQSLGCEVLGVDRDARGFEAGVPHIALDFNQPDFAAQLGVGSFDLVTAIEVIEHVENPISFFRNVGRMLSTRGVAVLTTPNVDSLAARAKFMFQGKIRTMDEYGDPTHISPIFLDLLHRQYLPLAGVRLRERLVFPSNGYQLSRKSIALGLRMVSVIFPGRTKHGDNNIFVLERTP